MLASKLSGIDADVGMDRDMDSNIGRDCRVLPWNTTMEEPVSHVL